MGRINSKRYKTCRRCGAEKLMIVENFGDDMKPYCVECWPKVEKFKQINREALARVKNPYYGGRP